MQSIYSISEPHLPEKFQISKYKFPSNYFQHLTQFLEDKNPEILLIAGDLIWGKDFSLIQQMHLTQNYGIFREFRELN